MEPIKMKYINGDNEIEVSVYKFSNPDAFGAVALCYIEPGTKLKIHKYSFLSATTEQDAMQDYTVSDNGEWQTIHCRYLKPL